MSVGQLVVILRSDRTADSLASSPQDPRHPPLPGTPRSALSRVALAIPHHGPAMCVPVMLADVDPRGLDLTSTLPVFSRNFAEEAARLHLFEAELHRNPGLARSPSLPQPSQLSQATSLRHVDDLNASLPRSRKLSVSTTGDHGGAIRGRSASIADGAPLSPSFRDDRSTARDGPSNQAHDDRSISRFSAYSASPAADARSTPTPGPTDRSLQYYSPVARVEIRPAKARAPSSSSSRTAVSPKQRGESRLSRLGSVLRKKTAA
jgi:hypothetical protein